MTCAHGRTRLCPFPGCPAGPAGDRIVCGIGGPKRYVRGFVVVGDEVRVGWVEDTERKEATWEAA
jgi:hypothetical protein